MATAPSSQSSSSNAHGAIEVRVAEPGDIESLATIHARAFHPVNAFVKQALPDTAAMRDWWRAVYREELVNAACHVLVAVDTNSENVVGVATLRSIGPNGPHGGLWTAHPWTDDHNRELWSAPIACMCEYEERLMGGKPYFLLELMAVDATCAGSGVGRRLVTRACEIADQARLPILLMSGVAKDFYLRLGMGFKLEAEPLWQGRPAAVVVRPVLGQS